MRSPAILCGSLLLITALSAAQAPSTDAQKVPVIDGAAGSCSLDLTVTAEGKPVYAATVKVHIAYKFGGFHKLDLEAATNVDGKVRFVGLPTKVRRPPLEFRASKDALSGTLNYNPETQCHATEEVKLGKTLPPAVK